MMKQHLISKCPLFVVVVLLTSLPAFGLTVDQAVQSGLANNLSLKRTALELATSRRLAEAGWTGSLPQLSAGVSAANSNASLGTATGLADGWTTGATLSIAANLNVAAFSAIETTRLAYESGKISYEQATRSLELNIRKTFYSLVLAKESIKLSEENLARAQSAYDEAQVRFKAGRISELELLNYQLAWEKQKPDLESSRAAWLNNLDSFRVVLGMAATENLELEGSLEQVGTIVGGLDSLIPDSGKNLDLKALAASLKKSQAEKTAAEWSVWLPSLSVAWSWSPSSVAGSAAKDTGGLSAEVSLSLSDFLPWSAKQEAVRAANDLISNLQLQITEQGQTITAKVQALVRAIAQNQRALQYRELNVKLTEQTWKLYQAAYSKGLRDLETVQTAEGDLNAARNAMLSERYNLIVNNLDLEYALGLDLGSGKETK